MKIKTLLWVIILVAFLAPQAQAVRLKAVQTLALKEVNLNYKMDSGHAEGVLKVVNPTHSVKKFNAFLVFLSDKSSKEVLRLPVKASPQSIKAMSERTVTFSLDNVRLPKGDYDAIFQLTVEGLGVSSVKSAGVLHVKNSEEPMFKYTIKCNIENKTVKDKAPVHCSISPAISAEEHDKFSLLFSVKKTGQLKEFFKDSFVLPNSVTDSIDFSIPLSSLPYGTMDISAKLLSKSAQSNVSYFRYFRQGDYTKILTLEHDPARHKVNFYINGSLYSKNRMLLVGMLDGGKVCQFQDTNLYSIAPLARSFVYDANKCKANSAPFVIIYKKHNKADDYTASDIIAIKGLKDRSVGLLIVRDVNSPAPKTVSERISSLISMDTLITVLAVIFLFVLLLAALVFAKKKNMLLWIIFALLPFVPTTYTHAEVFDSLDAPKARFEVNFPNITKEVGQNDDVIFSFSAIDNFAGGVNKYPGAEAYAWIDNATSTKVKIMDASDSKATVIATLPNSLSLGVHTLNFEVPASAGICGSAFDFSDFDSAVFDPQPCEFSVDFTVVPGSKISLTFYAQPKAVPVGSSSKLYWFSSGANSCLASDGWSGSKPTNNTAGADTGAINSSYKNFTLTCQNNSESVSRTDTVYTYVCGDNICSQWEDCNLCAQDCGACGAAGGKSVSISADPQLIREGGVSYITWHSNGYTSCNVSEDNPLVNDAWSRLAGVEKTSNLTKDTTYTVSCTDGSNNESKSVKVRIVPRFIEF